MGIPGFNTWFLSNNKQAYIPLSQVQCSHLYLDMNSILHNCLRKAHSYDKFHALLHKRLDAILRSVNPQKSVMLAIDGPAPLAKLITQRERRKKSFSSEERKKGRQTNKTNNQAKVVSSTALTPGTPFMHDICVSCLYYVCARLANRKWQHLEFEVSGPTVAGEGEVKILGRLARPRHPASVSPTDTHVIVGDDADLILMALVSMTPRLHILNAALSDNVLSPSTSVMSVDRLHALWMSRGLAGNPAPAPAPAATSDPSQQQQQQQQLSQDALLRLLGAKADLALFAVMASGNDYLPAVKGLKLDTLWSSYLRIRKMPEFAGSSIITMTVQPPGSSSSSDNGSGRELSVAAELDTVMLSEVLGVAIDGYNKHFAKANRPGAVAAAGGSGSGTVGLNREAAEAIPWLKGVLWTMSMYFAGDCPDYRWTYQGGNATITGLYDLAAAAAAGSTSSEHHRLTLGSFKLGGSSGSSSSSGEDSSRDGQAWRAAIAAAAARLGAVTGPRCDPMLPHVCSLALLPAGAQEHVPAAVQHLMFEESPIFDMYASCDACEAAADECYNAQRAYNDTLEQLKGVEAKIAELEKQGQPVPPELAAKHENFTASRADALAALHAAKERRVQHEVADHPEGLDTFDLDRLEAAVSSIPSSEYTGSQKTLTQLSHSMLLRLASNGQQQQQYGQYGYHSQQQQQQQPYYGAGQQYGQQRFGNQQQLPQQQHVGSQAGALRPFRPPPPPVERFGPAFSRSYGGSSNMVVQRSLLVETAYSCKLQEDRELWRYSSYMVLGTPAAAASDAAAATANDAAGMHAHKRKHEEQQQQQQASAAIAGSAAAAAALAASNTAAAAALKAALAAGRPKLVPTHILGALAPEQQKQQQQKQQQQQAGNAAAAAAVIAQAANPQESAPQAAAAQLEAARVAAAVAAAAAEAAAAATALASSSLSATAPAQQQRQQQQPQQQQPQQLQQKTRKHKSPSANSTDSANSSGDAPTTPGQKQQRRKKKPALQANSQGQQEQQQQQQQQKAAPAASPAAGEAETAGRRRKKSPAPAAPPAAASAAMPGAAAKAKPGFAGVAGGAFAVGPPPPPAPKTLPLPSGLLGRAASSSSINSAGSLSGAAGPTEAGVQPPQLMQPPAAAGYSGYSGYGGGSQPGSEYTNTEYYHRQQQHQQQQGMVPPHLPLPALAPPAPLPPAYPPTTVPYQQQQQQQPQLVRPVSPGYYAAGASGAAPSGGLHGTPYNPMRPPPLPVPGLPSGGAAAGAAGMFGAGIGRPPYPGML